MKVDELLATVKNSFDVHRVYAEPFTQNGVTVIAAAAVSGGGGGGNGTDEKGQQGEGGGFGLSARPVGAYVIKGDSVRWVPAFDLGHALSSLTTTTVLAAFVLRRRRMRHILRRYRKAHPAAD